MIIKDFITTIIGDRFLELLKTGTDRIADEIAHAANNRILEYLCVEYERNYRTKTILHRSEPIELKKVYQPLFLEKMTDRWSGLIPEFNRISTETIEPLFDEGNFITIIGSAGSGKSTLVKHLLVNAIHANYKIPIKVELRYLNNYNEGLLKYINEEIIKFTEIAERESIIERMLQSGEFVFFFDGYDEVSSNKKEQVTNDISRITKKYKDNKYILTSRPFVNVEMFDGFRNLLVCEMSPADIKSFVKRQFNDDIKEQELANKIIETIENDKKKTYKSFLSNPLLLSMFILTYQTDSYVPQRRSDYYLQVFNTLYSSHDTQSKLGFVRERITKLSKEDYMEILKRFSFKSYIDQEYTFTISYFDEKINSIKKNLQLSFNNDSLLEDFKVAIGILIEEGSEITYPHRSLQEYFAALYIASLTSQNNDDENTKRDKITQFINNSREYEIDYANFYSILAEVDEYKFKKIFILPMLHEVKKIVSHMYKNANNDEYTTIIRLFVMINDIASLIDEKMRIRFLDEDNKYSDLYVQYIQDEKNEKKRKAKNKDKMDDDDDDSNYISMSRSARTKLAMNNILPFLNMFDFDTVIFRIESFLKEKKQRESDFIDFAIPE